MSHEYYYTSAPRGLLAGTNGYCAVAMTRGLPPLVAEKLEELSGYKLLFSATDPRNPVNWAHNRLSVGGQEYHVVSRVCAAGLDYSERTNKFAHHVVLTANELPPGGPAWLLQQPGFMESEWDDGEPRWIPAGRALPRGDAASGVCRAWEAVTGDAGWAGVLAENFQSDPTRQAVLLHDFGVDVLPLIAEALALLSPAQRWSVTFHTYAAGMPRRGNCSWRGLPRDCPEGRDARALRGMLVLNLGTMMGKASGGALVEQARTGRRSESATGSVVIPPSPTTRQPVSRVPTAPTRGDSFAPMVPQPVAVETPEEPTPTYVPSPTRPAPRGRGPWFGFVLGLMSAALLVIGGLIAVEASSDRSLFHAITQRIPKSQAEVVAERDKQKEDFEKKVASLEADLKLHKENENKTERTGDQIKKDLEGKLTQAGKDLESAKKAAEMKERQLGEEHKQALAKQKEMLDRTKEEAVAELTKKVQDLEKKINTGTTTTPPDHPKTPLEPGVIVLPPDKTPSKTVALKDLGYIKKPQVMVELAGIAFLNKLDDKEKLYRNKVGKPDNEIVIFSDADTTNKVARFALEGDKIKIELYPDNYKEKPVRATLEKLELGIKEGKDEPKYLKLKSD